MVINQNQKSDQTNRLLDSLKHFFTAVFIFFLVLVMSSEARADEDTLSSTINIDSTWYVNEQEFEWNIVGENLSTLDIWYAYGSEAVDNTTWSHYETMENLTGQNETGQFTFNFTNGTGYYLLESNVFDTLNNSELGNTSANFTGELIKFDNLKPDSTTTLNSEFRPINSSINIPWSATDNLMLKSIQLEYSFSSDSETVSGNWMNYGTQNAEGLADSGQFNDFHFLEGEGRYDFRLIARDHAGNEELGEINTFVVLDGTPAQANYDYNGAYWVTGNTLIPWQISDNYELYSIEMRYCYKPNNSSGFGSWESFQTISLNGVADEGSFNFNLPEGQGVYNFWLIANDEAGNSNPDLAIGAGGLNLGYDIQDPFGVMSYDGSFWRNSEVTIQHSSQDNVDVAEVSLYYRFREDNSSTYSDYFPVETYETSGGAVTNGVMKANALSGDGFYQFRIEVNDSAGNNWISPNSNFNIGFDLEAPAIFLIDVTVESTNITYNDERDILYYSSNTVTNEVIEIDGYCYETTSGIVEGSTTFESSFAIFTDTSEGSTWSTTFTFAPFTSGNLTITITTLDNAGNSGTLTIYVVDDIEPPKTSIGLVIQGEVVDETENYTINQETKYSLSSYDAESGKKIIEYRFDEGDWLTYDDEPFTVPPKTSMIEYRAIDYVGNQENSSSLGVELMNMAPTAMIHSPSSSKVNIEKDENIYFHGSGEDLDGEITKYRWVSDIDGFISNRSSFNISNLSPGTHSIVFSVMDDQDSWSVVSVVTVNVSSDNQNVIYLLLVLALAGAVVCYNIYFNRGEIKEPHSDVDFQEEILEAEEVLNCASCGTGVKSDAEFCKNCGSNLNENVEPAIECVGCGEMVPTHKNFCKNCGENID